MKRHDLTPTWPVREPQELLELRRRHLGPNLSVAYREPLKIVRGRAQYLFDQDGRRYLDCVNNVCHVGHAHPRVVEAGARQMAELNTNTRYLHDAVVEYALRLTATLPPPLSVCYFVNSGSEANELALRMARARTGRRDLVVLDHAYHGHTQTLIDASPYKFDGAGGGGRGESTHVVPLPDPYRGRYRGPASGADYVAEVVATVAGLVSVHRPPMALLAESVSGCGGQVFYPDGFLDGAIAAVRGTGALAIVDEVQVGFGRIGSHTWAFEAQGVVPDVITLGKPIGNGHPMGAVVTTPDVAAAFTNGMEYFNTFGGNPVSAAIGLAVLDVIEEEGLRMHALVVGEHCLAELRALQQRHASIGDVRGRGLFLGIEVVGDRHTRTPDAATADALVQSLRHRGILLATDGPDDNVLKIKPPLPFSVDDADLLVMALDEALTQLQS